VVRQSDRAFGCTVAVVFVGIALVGWWLGGQLPQWALVMAATFAGVAWLVPGLLLPLNRFWGWMAPKIAALNNAVILGLVFYLVITPIGLVMKLFGRDSMCRAIQPTSDSYWTPVQHQSTMETLTDQF